MVIHTDTSSCIKSHTITLHAVATSRIINSQTTSSQSKQHNYTYKLYTDSIYCSVQLFSCHRGLHSEGSVGDRGWCRISLRNLRNSSHKTGSYSYSVALGEGGISRGQISNLVQGGGVLHPVQHLRVCHYVNIFHSR